MTRKGGKSGVLIRQNRPKQIKTHYHNTMRTTPNDRRRKQRLAIQARKCAEASALDTILVEMIASSSDEQMERCKWRSIVKSSDAAKDPCRTRNLVEEAVSCVIPERKKITKRVRRPSDKLRKARREVSRLLTGKSKPLPWTRSAQDVIEEEKALIRQAEVFVPNPAVALKEEAWLRTVRTPVLNESLDPILFRKGREEYLQQFREAYAIQLAHSLPLDASDAVVKKMKELLSKQNVAGIFEAEREKIRIPKKKEVKKVVPKAEKPISVLTDPNRVVVGYVAPSQIIEAPPEPSGSRVVAKAAEVIRKPTRTWVCNRDAGHPEKIQPVANVLVKVRCKAPGCKGFLVVRK